MERAEKRPKIPVKKIAKLAAAALAPAVIVTLAYLGVQQLPKSLLFGVDIPRLPAIIPDQDCLPNTETGLPVYSEAEEKRAVSKIVDYRNVLNKLIHQEFLLEGYHPVGDARVMDIPDIQSLVETYETRDLFSHAQPHLESNHFWYTAFANEKSNTLFQAFQVTTFYQDCGPLSHTKIEASVRPEVIEDVYSDYTKMMRRGDPAWAAIRPDGQINPYIVPGIMHNFFNLPFEMHWFTGFRKYGSIEVAGYSGFGRYEDGSKLHATIDDLGKIDLLVTEPNSRTTMDDWIRNFRLQVKS